MTTILMATARTSDVRLRVTSDAPGAVNIEVLRTMNGRTVQVRAWPLIDGGAWVHNDIDVLFGTPITYVARVYDAAGALLEVSPQVAGVVVRHAGALIRDALVPQQAVTLRLVGMDAGDSSSDVRREVLRPLGRSAPLAITDVRQATEGTTRFLTLTKAEQGQMERLLGSGNILFFTGPVDFSLSWPFYFSAGKVSTARVSGALSDARLWTMDWVEVDGPPVTEPTPAVTWQQLLDQGTKWRDIRITPWIDVMYPPTSPVRLRAG